MIIMSSMVGTKKQAIPEEDLAALGLEYVADDLEKIGKLG